MCTNPIVYNKVGFQIKTPTLLYTWLGVCLQHIALSVAILRCCSLKKTRCQQWMCDHGAKYSYGEWRPVLYFDLFKVFSFWRYEHKIPTVPWETTRWGSNPIRVRTLQTRFGSFLVTTSTRSFWMTVWSLLDAVRNSIRFVQELPWRNQCMRNRVAWTLE